jgi:hypothetical protein
MDIRSLLFPNFPRLFGNPKAFFIDNRQELDRNASINNSENDKNFASVCSYNSDKVPIFEDNFMETDESDPNPVRKVVLWYEARNIPWICLLSGNRGFHIHSLFKPEIISQKTLKNFANMILEETETKEMFDPHVSGVLEKLCRIPNTQRLNNGWCVPITRDELFSLNTPEEFKKLCASPRFIDFPEPNRLSILQFVKEDNSKDKPTQIIDTAPPKEVFRIKHILRPCVYKAILTPNPKNDFRICFVLESLNHGLTTNQIYDICLKLNWIDLDPSYTRYQIDYTEEQRRSGEFRIPFGKRRLGCEKKISCFQCVLNGE